MAEQAEGAITAELPVLNALNVFPVPDGDTGTNMLATIREAVAQARAAAPELAVERLATGAMLGARGNSGVILSQLFRASHETFGKRPSGQPDAAGLAETLERARELAYAAMSKPVEGTILSVLSAAAGAARDAGGDVTETLRVAISAAERALASTPDQMPLLREAGVVDAGGYGLLLVLRAWYESISGQPAPPIVASLLGLDRAKQQVASGTAHPADLVGKPPHAYGYCITLLLEAPRESEPDVRKRLQEMGDSVLVVMVERRLKLHVHAPDPEPVLRYACEIGTVDRSEISNIDEQTGAMPDVSLPIVAVAHGAGLLRTFRSLGATVVVGGQTQNPSTAELLLAAKDVPSPALLLPNNSNVVAVAQQAAASREGLHVLPTKSMPQGIAAVLAYDTQANLEINLANMARAAAAIRSAELTTAARAATLQGMEIAAGQSMVLLDGQLVGVGEDGLDELLRRVADGNVELATIYAGAEASREDSEELRQHIRAALPDADVEVVRGDQPQPKFIIGFE